MINTGAIGWVAFKAPSQSLQCCAPRHSGRLSHRSWPALPRFGHGMGMRLASGQAAAVWWQHGGNHGQRRQRFSAVLLYGIIRHRIVLAAA